MKKPKASRLVPPNSALRSFEASARHLSFKKAAEELLLTESAVSHQVANLERLLSIKLFDRHKRRLSLTEVGGRYFVSVRDGLNLIAAATANLHSPSQKTLVLSVIAPFAYSWLIPRLNDFYEKHPGIDIEIQTTQRAVDFQREKVSVGVRYGRGNWRGLHSIKLFDEVIFPICSREFAERHQLRDVGQLKDLPLLQNSLHPEEWHDWLDRFGSFRAEDCQIRTVESASLVAQAAAHNLGVAMARWPLIDDEIRGNKLIAPFPQRLITDHSYYFVCSADFLDRDETRAFKDWILANRQPPHWAL